MKKKPLARGARGNYKTVDYMKTIARKVNGHPEVRQLAENILNYYSTPDMYYFDEALAIGEYVQKFVRYVRDPQGIEMLTDPVTMIDKLKRNEAFGDCDDMALLIATLLLSIGHQPYFAIVKYNKNNKSYQHIYVVVYTKNYGEKKNRRLVLDAIAKQYPIGFEVPSEFKKEIKV
jgi:hypothetical protein